jgi:hypothetical protein
MSESIESDKEQFIFPNLEEEYGEFERVAKIYGFDDVQHLISSARLGKMLPLSEDVWSRLENTDSYDINEGDFEQVADLSAMVNRDWEVLREKMMAGSEIDAPIVMKHKDEYHVVSGNTRLMVARAAGIKPTILLFEF